MPDQTTREQRIAAWKRSRRQAATRDQFKTLYEQLEEEDAGLYQVNLSEDQAGNQIVQVTRIDDQEEKGQSS